MAFFKFRQRGQAQPEPRRRADASAAPQAQETVDGLRRRARHRLVGAVVLVLVAVIGFPLLFDTQPRPVTVDAPITIPDKDKMPPLRAPSPVPAGGGRVSDAASLSDKEEVLTTPGPGSRTQATGTVAPARVTEGRPAAASRPAETRPEPKPDARADARAAEDAARARREEEAKAKREEEARAKREESDARTQREADAKAKREAEAKRQEEAKARRDDDAQAKRDEVEAKAKAKREEAARARAILEGRNKPAAADAASDQGRFIIQVGAFAEDSAAREARQQAERAGVKTYTQVVDTKDGKRTRVRVGPFSSRAEAEKAAAALKKAGLGGSILSL